MCRFLTAETQGPLIAVRAIIVDKDGRILLLKRSRNDEYGDFWCLPGGKIDFGQTAEEAIAREVQEETALICDAIEFFDYLDGLPRQQGEKHYITLIFKCQTRGELFLNRESSEYTWVGPDEQEGYQIAFNNDEAMKNFWSQHNADNHIKY